MLEPQENTKNTSNSRYPLGTVSTNITNNLRQISPNLNFNHIQKTTPIGTAHILQNFVTPHKDLDP